ncbi:MAG: mechanosensitive ion channel family protein [Adhaeribacter sp.]
MPDIKQYSDIIFGFLLEYGGRILGALIILFIGFWIIKRLSNFVDKQMQSHHVDPSLRPFLRNVLNIGLKILLLIAVVSQLGMAMTSVFAVLGSVGLAIGLALQGSLSNFAGGVLILALKPFRVGDNIEAQGVSGKVYLINIMNTVIKTADNKTIFIPNGPLANTTIVNMDMEATRRADLRIVVQYGNDLELAKKLIRSLIAQDRRILPDPAPQVVTENLETGVAIHARVWSLREDLGNVTNDLQDQIRFELEKENIGIAWRQPELLPRK